MSKKLRWKNELRRSRKERLKETGTWIEILKKKETELKAKENPKDNFFMTEGI